MAVCISVLDAPPHPHTITILFPDTYILESVQDLLIKLGIKPLMHLLEISVFSLNNVIIRLDKIISTLKIKVFKKCPPILRSLTRLFIILVSLTRSLFSEKMLISNRCISGLMPNLIKKSWTVSSTDLLTPEPPEGDANFDFVFPDFVSVTRTRITNWFFPILEFLKVAAAVSPLC